MLNIQQPSTVYIAFDVVPNVFKLYHERYGLYHFRHLEGKYPRIKFNLPHVGKYNSPTPFKVLKIVPIEIPAKMPSLPEYERNDIKDFSIVNNFDLSGSPARMFRKEGIVELGKRFYEMPKPIRMFILLHEVGHFFYGLTDADYKKAEQMGDLAGNDYLKTKRAASEEKCDLFALIHYAQFGYNLSMAFYSLSKMLSRSPANIKRLKTLFNNIQKLQDVNKTAANA